MAKRIKQSAGAAPTVDSPAAIDSASVNRTAGNRLKAGRDIAWGGCG